MSVLASSIGRRRFWGGPATGLERRVGGGELHARGRTLQLGESQGGPW